MRIRGKLLLLAAGIAVPLVVVGTLDLRNMWRLSRSQLDDSVEISIESKPGNGTTFNVILPAWRDAVTAKQNKECADVKALVGS